MSRALAIAILASSLLACSSAPPRVVAPLRYDAAPPAPDEPFRASPPTPLASTPLPSLPAATSTLSNGMRLVVVPRKGHPTTAVRLAFARDVVDLGDQGGVRMGLLPPVYFVASSARDGASARCGDNGCVFGAEGTGESVSALLRQVVELAHH